MSDVSKDRLKSLFDQQDDFMKLLCEKRNFPVYPVDLTSKTGQRFIKGIAYETMGELFEAVQELKNSKDHRVTKINDLDHAAFLEEVVDAAHYFFELVIAAGISSDEFYDAYIQKGNKNVDRILNGY